MNTTTDTNTRKTRKGTGVLIILAASLLLFTHCADDGSSDSNQDAILTTGAVLSSIWDTIDPATEYPGFTYNGLEPSCSSCPPVGQKTYNEKFYFFYKEGTVNRLLLFFEGGGMCWDITNCVYEHTYSEEVSFTPFMLGALSSGFSAINFENYPIGGILDATNDENPFKDWHMVYIPYCTGDLGIGRKDNVYVDDYGGGPNVTIRHRGAVNVQVVLQWLSDNLEAPDEVFVTGASAGSMSSFFNLPFIREQYLSATMTWYGDSAVGVLGTDSSGNNALDYAVSFWGGGLPLKDNPINYSAASLDDITVENFYIDIINHYSGANLVNFATYTTEKDAVQAWFYDIQNGDKIDHPENWGLESQAMPSQAVLDDWEFNMYNLLDAIDTAVTTGKYSYYVGTGTDHTMIYSDKFYLENTGGGVLFLDWIEDVRSGSLPGNPTP